MLENFPKKKIILLLLIVFSHFICLGDSKKNLSYPRKYHPKKTASAKLIADQTEKTNIDKTQYAKQQRRQRQKQKQKNNIPQQNFVDIPNLKSLTYFVSHPVSKNLLSILSKYKGMKRVYSQKQADLALNLYTRSPAHHYKKNAMKAFIEGERQIDKKQKYTSNLNTFDLVQKRYLNFSSKYFYPQAYEIQLIKDSKHKNFHRQTTQDELKVVHSKLNGIWILKNVGTVQGNGIKMIHDIEAFQKTMRLKQQGIIDTSFDFKGLRDGTYILQKYIENPLLVEGKKFDIKLYVAVHSTDPFVMTYHFGYFVTTDQKFDLSSKEDRAHIVNNAYQYFKERRQAKTQEEKDKLDPYSNCVMPEKFLKMLRKEYPQFDEKAYELFQTRIKAAATYSFQSVLPYMQKKNGNIQVFSMDLVMDTDFIPNVIEVNSYPNIAHWNTDTSRKLQMPLLENWLKLGLYFRNWKKQEIIEKSQKDPKFFCKYVNEAHCDVIINTAADYFYIDEIDTKQFKKPKHALEYD